MSLPRLRTMQSSRPAGGQSLSDILLLLLALCTLTAPHRTHAGGIATFVEEPASAVISHHAPVTLRCRVDPPDAQVQWLFNRKPLDFREHRGLRLENNTDLHFPHFSHGPPESTNDGEYRCTATSQNVTVVSRPATLLRPVLRKFPPSPNMDISAPEGGYAVLPCTGPESEPPARVEIVTDFGLLLGQTRGDNLETLPSGSVILRNLKAQDSGVYKCLAINPVSGANRTAGHNITLHVTPSSQVQDVPTVIVDKSFPTLQVASGDSVLLECPTAGAGTPDVTWTKYGGDLPSSRMQMEFGNLRIHAVNVMDKGTYICETKDGESRKLSLEVNTPPVILAMSGDRGMRAMAGETVKITCSGAGFPSPTVVWFHNGAVVGRRKIHSRGDEHTLMLENVQVENSGIYTCDLANILGHISAQVHLTVDENNDNLSAGSDNDLTTANGQSTDSPVGEVLGILDDLVDGEERKAESPDSSKKQTAKKKNDGRNRKRKNKRKKYKKNRGNVEKVILVPPSPPSVSRLSDTSVMVNWSVPENDGLPITFFRVQYKEVKPNKGPWQTLDRDIDAKARRYEVSRLKAGGTYKFRIAAVYSNNDNKIGPNSRHFHLALLSNPELHPPKVKPKVVEAKPIIFQNIYAIGIKWQYLPVDPSPIEGFHIFYKPFDSAEDFENITLIGAGIRSHTVTDLKPDTEYTIKMQCFNTAGVSDYSNIVVKRTLPAVGQSPASLPTPIIPPDEPTVKGPETPGRRETVNMDHPVILGSVLGFMLLLLVVFIVMCLWKQRQQKRRNLNTCNKFQDQAQRIYSDSLGKKYPNGQYPLNGLNGLVLANGHGPHGHHKMNIDVNPLSEMESHPSLTPLPHDMHSGKIYHQGNSIPNGTSSGYSHGHSSDNNFNSIRQTVSTDSVHVYSGLVPNGVGVRSLPRNGNTPTRHAPRRYPLGCQSKFSVSSMAANSSCQRPGTGSGSCSPSDAEYSPDEEDAIGPEGSGMHPLPHQTGQCQSQGCSMNGRDSLEGLSCDQRMCDGFEGFRPAQCAIISESVREESGYRPWESRKASSSPSSSYSGKHKKRRKRPQNGREHSTKDQATNTDLSSNEGTIEFTMFSKSPSSSVSNSSDDKPLSSLGSQCLGMVTVPMAPVQTAVPL